MKKAILTFLLTGTLQASFCQNAGVTLTSTDTALQGAFNRAKQMALKHRGDPADPVGPWYESALPPRSAFCMRDVSHMATSGEILGMSRENKNMFTKFVSNISESKDWCTYWEIDKWNRPCPADYRNDKEFWYNLPANFDVLNASYQLYLWTGDTTYISNPAFTNFFEKTVNEFIAHWALQSNSIMTRPRICIHHLYLLIKMMVFIYAGDCLLIQKV